MKTLFLLLFFVIQANAKHPSLIETNIEGISYICRPTLEKIICPEMDPRLHVVVAVDILACLLNLSEQNEKKQILSCYSSEKYKNFLDKIQLIHVSEECLNEHVSSCQKDLMSASASISESYKNPNWLITQEEALGACKGFVY